MVFHSYFFHEEPENGFRSQYKSNKNKILYCFNAVAGRRLMRWFQIIKGCGWALSFLGMVTLPVNAGGLSTPAHPKDSAGNVPFAVQIFQALGRQQPGVNTVISPVSIYTALMMAADGAHGATRAAMLESLGVAADQQDRVNMQLSGYMKTLQSGSGPATVHMANGMWTSKNIVLKDEYVRAMTSRYRALIRPLPAGDPTGAVNQWVSEQTHGKIDHMVEDIDPNSAMLLINAVYFKDAWQTPFPVEATRKGLFYPAVGESISVDYMERAGLFNYLAAEKLQLVGLPYKDPRFCLYLILPKPEMQLKDIIDAFSPKRLAGWLEGMRNTQGRVVLPRFKLKSKLTLLPALSQMGMGVAFDARQADFGGITDLRPFALGDVQHHCVLSVNEAGSEAAAATAVMMLGALPPAEDAFEFIAKRPFFCLLYDQTAGRIVFMAAVHHPAIQ